MLENTDWEDTQFGMNHKRFIFILLLCLILLVCGRESEVKEQSALSFSPGKYGAAPRQLIAANVTKRFAQ